MLSDDDVVALSDIQFNIELAEHFVEGLDLDHFVGDMKSFYAVTRCLEIISEASRRISPAFKERFPDIPWKDIAGSGNIYRHNYEDVLERRVWKTVREALPQLHEIVAAELRAYRAHENGHGDVIQS
jgi:uncharacterized protein with HEPN domain